MRALLATCVAAAAIAGGATLAPRASPKPTPAEGRAPASASAGGEATDGTCVAPAPRVDCRDGMCRIPAACFIMGSREGEPGRAPHAESPIRVIVDHDFEIQQHELTRGEAAALAGAPPLAPAAGSCVSSDCPLDGITWFEAAALANAMSASHGPEPLRPCYVLRGCSTASEGMSCEAVEIAAEAPTACEGYRLPTEAEWEWAARADTRSATYAGDLAPADDVGTCQRADALESIAWYCANAGGAVHPVGGKRANAFGVFDMLGNVAEWVHDRYAASREPGARVVDVGGPTAWGPLRVFRGGSVVAWPSLCRAATRLSAPAGARAPGLGVRFARTLR